MKRLLPILCFLPAFTAATAQDRAQPVFNSSNPQMTSFENFASNRFRVLPEVADTLERTCEPARTLFSFVVNSEGRADSLIFHENKFAGIEKEIRRFIASPENRWKPVTKAGQPVASAPVYCGVLIVSDACERNKGGAAPADLRFFRQYPYKNLPNWQAGSIISEPLQVVVFPAIRCSMSPGLTVTDVPSKSPAQLQQPVAPIPYRPHH
jgi:hypothetical protein